VFTVVERMPKLPETTLCKLLLSYRREKDLKALRRSELKPEFGSMQTIENE
jgi:hypothetical protein